MICYALLFINICENVLISFAVSFYQRGKYDNPKVIIFIPPSFLLKLKIKSKNCFIFKIFQILRVHVQFFTLQ